MRWSEAQYQAYVQRGQPAPMSEKTLQAVVVRLLKKHGYTLAYHTWDSRRSPSGFPDLIACHEQPGRPLMALELKTDTGQVTLPQQHWLDALAQCTSVQAQVLRPAGLEAWVHTLREERR